MKEKLNISLVITIATILISVGVSWGIVQSKIADVDKLKDKSQEMDNRQVKLEANLDALTENSIEQKSMMKEVLTILLENKTKN